VTTLGRFDYIYIYINLTALKSQKFSLKFVLTFQFKVIYIYILSMFFYWFISINIYNFCLLCKYKQILNIPIESEKYHTVFKMSKQISVKIFVIFTNGIHWRFWWRRFQKKIHSIKVQFISVYYANINKYWTFPLKVKNITQFLNSH
jgi:hypothetical protein